MCFPHRSFLGSVLFSILLFCGSALSQNPVPTERPDNQAQTETKNKAIDLLLSVLGQADGLRSPENRARIRSNAAEVLWDTDEKKARSVFRAVVDDINTGFSEYQSEHDFEQSERYQPYEQYQDLMVFWQLRVDTVDRIAKHDSDLALEFLKATKPSEAIKLPYQLRAAQDALGLRLAREVASKNPELALKIARESLAQGFSSDLLAVLVKMRRKDKEVAQTFYLEIVAKLRDANFSTDRNATVFAMTLARNFRPPDADEQSYRDLLGVMLNNALANGCNKDEPNGDAMICYAIRPIFSELQKYYGQRSAGLKRWAPDGLEYYTPYYYEGNTIPPEVSEVAENGTANELLELAEKYPQARTQIYWQAFTKSATSGDLVTARKIASQAPTEELRNSMLSRISEAEKLTAKSDERMAFIQTTLSKLRSDEDRIQFLLSIATMISTQDRKAALDLMDQASQLVEKTKPERNKLKGQVNLAIAYAYLKNRRGFVIIESMIPKLNQLVAAAMQLDGVETAYVRDEEWNMNNQGVIGALLAVIAANAGYFAAIDFDRSVALANQLERPELRLMAELKIAQGVFRVPERINFRRTYYNGWVE